MKLMAAMRCRTYAGKEGYSFEIRRERVSNALTGVQKDNVVISIDKVYCKDDGKKS